MAGLYVHIPFCKSRCIYCGFYSTTLLDWQDRYVEALCREMRLRSETDSISTIYLGGGTPSQLGGRNLRKLFDTIALRYGLSDEDFRRMEVTMECNPDDITADFCQVLSTLPVNRISMGAQTFSDSRLRFLHRRHTGWQVDEAVERLRAIGIGNISIDLMFGFPDETLADWTDDIHHALQLDVEHISAYALMIEEGTPLYERMKNEKLKIKNCGDEVSRQMYERLIDLLEAAGYEHYEISNWAKSGYRSRHNSSYWHDTPYIGLGAAAHSYDLLTRSWNVSSLKDYVEAIEQGNRPCELEAIDDETHYNDLVTTALRTREGINLLKLEAKYRDYLLENARKSLACGLLQRETTPSTDQIHLTRAGLFVSDDVMSDLILI